MPVDAVNEPEILMCLSPIWTDKHETAKRLAQRIKTVLDVAKSKGLRSEVERAYARSDLLERRRELMVNWTLWAVSRNG